MQIKYLIFLIVIAAQNMACAKETDGFTMQVEQVDELRGFVLKGIAISGTIKSGCIANENEWAIKRNGKTALSETAKILSIKDLKNPDSFNGEAYKGENVTFYIPDGKKQDVQLGDIVSSATAACPKGPVRK